jgi:hypothetical protein
MIAADVLIMLLCTWVTITSGRTAGEPESNEERNDNEDLNH